MKKRLLFLLLLLLLALFVSIPALAAPGSPGDAGGGNSGVAGGGLNNFTVRNTYISGQFTDVESSAWYAMAVQAGYEYGLFGGVTSSAFLPGGVLTTAEAIKLADSLNSIYRTGGASAEPSQPWYKTYEDDAVKNGLLASPPDNASAPLTRAEFAELIAKALPSEAFPAVCRISDNAIPDVSVSDSFGPAVYKLYSAGVLNGCDKFGTFRPFDRLTRAEAAVIVARAASTGFRKGVTLPQALTGDEIFKKCAPAVFYLERYDSEGFLIGIGSGFFITRDGLAVTNYHVISGAASAAVTTADGREFKVKGICGYNTAKDIAILQIDGGDFPYLDVTDSAVVEVGAQVYTIGSPLGLQGTISEGIVSNVLQNVNGAQFIQFSAPISMGSGGGPIVNTQGQVVGVSCLTVLNGQTLNFAVPSSALNGLSREGCVPLISIVAKNADAIVYYKSYFPVPDYGVFVGTPIHKTTSDWSKGIKTYYYKLSAITAPDSVAVDGYLALLKQHGFNWQSSYTNGAGKTVDIYYNASFDMSVHFGIDDLQGVACRFIAIY